MSPVPGPLPSAAAGFRLPLEGAGLLLRERSLWGLALVPFTLSLLAFSGAAAAVIAYAPELHDFVTAWMPELEAARWYAWLWIGPARLGLWLLGILLFLLLAGLGFVAAFLLASVLAAPFLDALSARVERVVTGGVDDRTESGAVGLAREALRSLLLELRKLASFLAVVVPLTAIGFVVPGAHLLTGPAVLAFTVFFLPLDYASYTLDRRHVGFPERRRWLAGQPALTAGFGTAAFLLCSVPVVNFLAMPLLVAAGTLLVLRYGAALAPLTPPAPPAPPPGSATSP